MSDAVIIINDKNVEHVDLVFWICPFYFLCAHAFKVLFFLQSKIRFKTVAKAFFCLFVQLSWDTYASGVLISQLNCAP